MNMKDHSWGKETEKAGTPCRTYILVWNIIN